MKDSIDVSVLIVNWNSWKVLRECLKSIQDNCVGVNYEIIVIDNASTDNSCDNLAREFPSVRLIENDVNRGFSTANNQGIRCAGGRYLLLLNPDTIIHEGAIEATIRFADARPKCGMLGCKTLNADGSLQRNCFLPPSAFNFAISTLGLHLAFPRNSVCGRERMTYWDLDDSREVANIAGCYMLARREAVEEVGLLDEDFFMYSEEVDWCQRFRNAGWEVWYTPEGTITHLGGVSSAQNSTEMKLEGVRSLIIYIQKHCGIVECSVCRLLLALTQITRMPVVVWRAPGVKSAFDALRRTLLQLRIVFSNGKSC